MLPDDIRLNQLVEIEYLIDSDTVEYLPSRVEGKSDQYLYLAVPIRRGELVPLRIGSNIKVVFTAKKKTYAFETKITNRHRDPIPVLEVEKPSQLIKIQRRSYVRLPANLDVTFTILPDEAEYKGITLDISAGGALILTKAHLEKGQLLNFKLNLPKRESIYCKAKVLRIIHKAKNSTEENKIAIQFINLRESKEDQIFNYIFEKQREWIQKGLLME
ncbi:MAG: hypothetical protein GX790_03250 [Syntrophomonadaceae bacterium]|nr:hypothetical protein [Syntrophomonadaceae bacterium]